MIDDGYMVLGQLLIYEVSLSISIMKYKLTNL